VLYNLDLSLFRVFYF